MINVKLTRDEARAMQQYFFTYIEQLVTMKERDANNLEEKLNEHIITDTFKQVQLLFVKKLFNKGNNLKFSFEDTQAIILYKLLLHLPIDGNNIWLLQLRQLFCNVLYSEIMKRIDTLKKRQPVETG